MNSLTLLNSIYDNDWVIPFSIRLEARLTKAGALNLLATAIRIASVKEAIVLCDAYLDYHRASYPTPYLEEVADEAKWHASIATPSERLTHCIAHFQQLEPRAQVEFLANFGCIREAV